LLALQGLGAESMVRDQAWSFLDGGRRLERALQLIQLLRTTLPSTPPGLTGSLVIESVVTAAESIVTYRRRSRLHWHLETVLELLLLDPENPRSVAFQLDHLAADLDAVPRTSSRLRSDQRLVLEAHTMLRTCDPADLVDAYGGPRGLELDAFLGGLERTLMAAADAVEGEHFLLRLPQQRISGDVR
jgi:uncharacterized alpha-E superfamily protein